MYDLNSCSAASDSTFLFKEPGQSRFFGPKRLAPDKIAFADSLSLRALLITGSTKGNLSLGRSSRVRHRWPARLAIYSAALADLLIRADVLVV